MQCEYCARFQKEATLEHLPMKKSYYCKACGNYWGEDELKAKEQAEFDKEAEKLANKEAKELDKENERIAGDMPMTVREVKDMDKTSVVDDAVNVKEIYKAHVDDEKVGSRIGGIPEDFKKKKTKK